MLTVAKVLSTVLGIASSMTVYWASEDHIDEAEFVIGIALLAGC